MCLTSAGNVSHPSGSQLACPEQQHCRMCPSPSATLFPPWSSLTSSCPESLSILWWDGAADPRTTRFQPSSLAAQQAEPSLLSPHHGLGSHGAGRGPGGLLYTVMAQLVCTLLLTSSQEATLKPGAPFISPLLCKSHEPFFPPSPSRQAQWSG